jgi:hypothetical protein
MDMQLLFTLILDGLLGILCGWMIRRWSHAERTSRVESVLREDVALLKNQLTVAREDFVRERDRAALSCDQLAVARDELQRTTARLKESEDDAATLKRAVADTSGALAVRARHLLEARTEISELEAVLIEKARKTSALEIRIAELEPLVFKLLSTESHSGRLPAPGNELVFPHPTPERSDDLQKIFGIGPVCERKLNEAGVRLFSQIAAWTKEDVVRFKALLPKWGDRILRDKWVERARELHQEKYGPVAMRMAC